MPNHPNAMLDNLRAGSVLRGKVAGWLAPRRTALESLVLLIIRLYWGWEFFLTGKGKLVDLEKPTQFFQSLGIPFPHQQAVLVGVTECVGGLFLLVGLASRLICVPQMILLAVAYLTADIDRFKMIFSDPDKFLAADEFLFLFSVVLVFAFGPGRFSLDWLFTRKLASQSTRRHAAVRFKAADRN